MLWQNVRGCCGITELIPHSLSAIKQALATLALVSLSLISCHSLLALAALVIADCLLHISGPSCTLYIQHSSLTLLVNLLFILQGLSWVSLQQALPKPTRLS